jgi:hypothetical protein
MTRSVVSVAAARRRNGDGAGLSGGGDMDTINGIFEVFDSGVDASAEFMELHGYPAAIVIDVDGGTIAGPIMSENVVIYEPGVRCGD